MIKTIQLKYNNTIHYHAYSYRLNEISIFIASWTI